MDQFLRFVNPDNGWLAEMLVLFVIPYVHEDVAILGAALLIVEYGMPTQNAVLSLYAGMVTSDVFLYGLGVLARHNAWARRFFLKHEMARITDWLASNLMPLMVLARVLPGVMFPAYVAFGFCRVSFVRFTAMTMATAAVYLPVVLFLIEKFGQEILTRLGYWAWVLAFAFVVVAFWNLSRTPNWGLLFRGSRLGFGGILHGPAPSAGDPNLKTHSGMPGIGNLPTRISFAERIPVALFYIPLALQWMWLGLRYRSMSLPCLANPLVEVGGLWGESKSDYLRTVGPDEQKWSAAFTTIRRGRGASSLVEDRTLARDAIAAVGLSFPMVVKPDIGWRGYGVRLVKNEAELDRYIEQYPEGETLLLQQLIEWDGEAGVLYARLPGEDRGRIHSLTFRYFPYVVGNGKSSLRELIISDQRAAWKVGSHLGLDPKHRGAPAEQSDRVPAAGEIVRLSFIGSNRVGGLYRDARQHITEAMTLRFDAISRSIPEFYYGRFDVRFRSVERFEQGEDFLILEINGAGGESINVWDPTMPLEQVYKELFEQQRLIFEIGAKNRARGYRPPGPMSIAKAQWRQHNLILRYPPSS